MKILVFDDSPLHRKSAAKLLKDHDITIVGTYDEAREALRPQTDYDKMHRIMRERFGEPEERSQEYWDAQSKVCQDCTTKPDFEVVLTELLVPASSEAQGQEGRRFVGQEMPIGTIIALQALAMGVKLVAVVTDTNHHDHPASACFDSFPEIIVGEAKMLCLNRGQYIVPFDAETFEEVSVEFLYSTEGQKKHPNQGSRNKKDIVWVKAWNLVLAELVKK